MLHNLKISDMSVHHNIQYTVYSLHHTLKNMPSRAKGSTDVAAVTVLGESTLFSFIPMPIMSEPDPLNVTELCLFDSDIPSP